MAAAAALTVTIYRPFCRFLCPLGAFLGLVSKLNRYKMLPDGCKQCGSCMPACRLQAIDGGRIDKAECILCGDCIEKCTLKNGLVGALLVKGGGSKMFNKAEMLNRRAAHPKFKADEVIRLLEIKQGNVIADIGSGGGYFAMRLAESAGRRGRVYAVDTNPKLLAYVEKAAKEQNITNIVTVPAGEIMLKLPNSCCDLIFLRNVFHHLEDPEDYFNGMRRFLKPEGRVAVIDYKKSTGLSIHALMRHCADEDFIRNTLTKAGFEPVNRYDLLPEQSFNIFKMRENK